MQMNLYGKLGLHMYIVELMIIYQLFYTVNFILGFMVCVCVYCSIVHVCICNLYCDHVSLKGKGERCTGATVESPVRNAEVNSPVEGRGDVRGEERVRGEGDVSGGEGVRGGGDVRGGEGVRGGERVRGGGDVGGGEGVGSVLTLWREKVFTLLVQARLTEMQHGRETQEALSRVSQANTLSVF